MNEEGVCVMRRKRICYAVAHPERTEAGWGRRQRFEKVISVCVDDMSRRGNRETDIQFENNQHAKRRQARWGCGVGG